MELKRCVFVPDYEVQQLKKDELNSMLYITYIGIFPKAKWHYMKREDGCDQNILIYCTSGKGWISLNGKKFTVSTNELFIIPKDIPHSYGSDKQNPWTIYWVHFLGKMSHAFSLLTKTPLNIDSSNTDRIGNRIELFEEMLQNLEMGFSNENIQYANICLLHFLASFRFLEQYRQIRNQHESDCIDNTIRYMKKYINSPLTLMDLSAQANLSKSQYSLLFKKKTGKSPLAYMIQLRMQEACRLLDNTSLKIKDIASQISYEDPYYFSRIFTKTIGASPRDYRKLPKG